MRNSNKKWVTLLEMVIYLGILSIASVTLIAILMSGIKHNVKTTLFLEQTRNIATSQKHLLKATENINDVLLLSHKKVGTHISSINDITIGAAFLNQKQFNLWDLQVNCGFIKNNDYDLVAFSSKDNLDPIVIGVIADTTSSWRAYYQLAIYKYYSLYFEKDRIEQDKRDGNISNYIDSEWQYITEGLTSYKCNKDNGFITPISSKFYIDEQYDYTSTTFLSKFKVIPYIKTNSIDEIQKYGVGLVEIELDWETRDGERSSTVYHSFSRTFNY